MWAASKDAGVLVDRDSAEKGSSRARTDGKFLSKEDSTFFVKGVTYGTFRPNGHHQDYPAPHIVASDFREMRNAGINTVRLYTAPPRWLLDCAHFNDLAVIVGLPWSQHIAFLDDAAMRRDIIHSVRAAVTSCAGHPAILAYAVGNEIPAPVVRWHGAQRIERFLRELYRTAKNADADALVTYANYPSTEYLDLSFMDFSFYNVYLESTHELDAYIARLQSRAGDKPLLLAELGLDSRRHGESVQARTLYEQIATAFGRGCAGVCVFAWTDEWHRGGFDVDDWDFGLTTRRRRPKAALAAVSRAFAAVPQAASRRLPRMSVVVCTYNGAATIRECLEGLARLEYPDFEVIVIDDGSTDATAAIVSEYDVRLISTPNKGLSAARNTGMRAATGEIIAFIDDDAYPDSHWLTYLARTFETTRHAAVGGPNLAPPGDGLIARAVDRSPGNPVHILLGDDLAEHIPGCNMAVRKTCLQAIGGFDPQFRVAGDDVDMCWSLQARGWSIGFAPAAVVWHHRRGSVRGFWRQQIGYGRAEAQLERKWPEKYNGFGHAFWRGRVYGAGGVSTFRSRHRIYQGVWGSAAYQSAVERPPGALESLLTMPEWYLTLGALLLIPALMPFWERMVVFVPLLPIATGATVVLAARGASGLRLQAHDAPFWHRATLHAMTTLLRLLQPVGRLWGRLSQGLTPWRHHNAWGYALPLPGSAMQRSDSWRTTHDRLSAIKEDLLRAGYVVRSGAPFDRWDLEVVGGLSCSSRLRVLVEEHGSGSQFIRVRYWPRFSPMALSVVAFFTSLSAVAVWDGARLAGVVLGVIAIGASIQILRQAAAAAGATRTAIRRALTTTEESVSESADVIASVPPAAPESRNGAREEAAVRTLGQPSRAKREAALSADIKGRGIDD